MNVSYKREMRHNYLILEAMEEEEGFEIRMLTGNTIEGLLKFRIKQEEQARYYYYEITSKQPLSRLLEFKEIKKEELSRLIIEIGAILNRLEDYLLSETNIFLEPEHIYIEPEFYQVWLCYVPGYQKSFPEAMEKLLQYLLKKTDHKDNDTVVLAYRLYQESQKDYYGIDDLLRIVRESQQGKLKEPSQEEKKTEENQVEETPEEWEFYREKIRKTEEEKEKLAVPNHGKIKLLAGVAALVLLGPVLIWLAFGTAGLWRYKTGLLLSDIAAAAGALIYLWRKKRRALLKEKKDDPGVQGEWQMHFEKEEDTKALEKEKKIKVYKENSEDISWENEEIEEGRREEEENTVLLAEASAENGNIHILKSVNPAFDDIPIPYFPFIIGKQEGIVDYVLNRDTVSRIHLRIDEEDGHCRVTDLNSSNGTAIGNYHLEANESYPVSSGDKLTIAELSFVFY